MLWNWCLLKWSSSGSSGIFILVLLLRLHGIHCLVLLLHLCAGQVSIYDQELLQRVFNLCSKGIHLRSKVSFHIDKRTLPFGRLPLCRVRYAGLQGFGILIWFYLEYVDTHFAASET